MNRYACMARVLAASILLLVPALGASATTVSAMPTTSDLNVPSGNLPGWRQIFTDDFTTNVPLGQFPAAVSGKWNAYPSPWTDTSDYGTYSPKDVVSITGGVLDKHIHTADGVAKIAAITPKLPGASSSYGVTYGRFAVRFRTDPIPGYKMAWLLWPDSGGNLANGEIDFPEMNLDSKAVGAYMHRTNAASGADQAWFLAPAVLSEWHTAVIEWSPNLVVFLLDGIEIGRTTERVPSKPMHWVLQTETRVNLTAPPSPAASGHVQIDWVAAWAYDPSIKAPATPTVSVTSPAANAAVSSVVKLAAGATGATSVKWYVDGVQVAYSASGAPWTGTWDSRLVANGVHRMFAKALTTDGRWLTSVAINLTVSNG